MGSALASTATQRGARGIAARRGLLVLALGFGLGLHAEVGAQRAKVHRVGWLSSTQLNPVFVEAFSSGLRTGGNLESRHFAHDFRYLQEKSEREVVLGLVRDKPGVIYAVGPAALAAAAAATRDLPIIAIDLETDPVAAGYAERLSRPGRNVTGVFLDAPEIMVKSLGLLKEVAPKISRVGVIWDPAAGPYQLAAVTAAARSLQLEMRVFEARSTPELVSALAAGRDWRPDALLQLSSPVVYVSSPDVAKYALEYKLPAISLFRVFPEAGGLLSFGVDMTRLFSRSGALAAQVLRGTRVGEIPIERPTNYSLVVNLRTARALGVTIPPSLLVRADHVIQ